MEVSVSYVISAEFITLNWITLGIIRKLFTIVVQKFTAPVTEVK